MTPSEIDRIAMDMADAARQAQHVLARTDARQRTNALNAAANAVEAQAETILAANARDMDAARAAGRPAAFLDRLALDATRLAGIAQSIRDVALQPDPLGEIIEEWTPSSGVAIRQVRVPIGTLAVIFESRPNVAADAAALALRSGNAVILRGGSDSQASAMALIDAVRTGIETTGLPADIVQHPATTDRAFVGALLSGLEGRIDLVVPRGGRDLVARVQAEARVAVLGHLDGICHAYVHASADPDMAISLVVNSKMRRTGVCNALECLLLDRSVLDTIWPRLAVRLSETGCRLRADAEARAHWPEAEIADDGDWGHEYLDAVLAARTVDGLDEAMAHIARYGSGHTDMVVSEDETVTEHFLNAVDSAVVLANATTGLSDGGAFGFGAEIGIATSKLHARGPVGAQQLTTYKYQLRGAGQIRD